MMTERSLPTKLAELGELPCACALQGIWSDDAYVVARRPTAEISLRQRLDRIARAASSSRRLARRYLRSAQALLSPEFRSADELPVDAAGPGRNDALDNRLRARRCLSFAGLCRQRAVRLGRAHDTAGG
jgi:hypothetical protein